ncbi:BrnT family toxin [Metapseudomonas furukawaii]|uniref:BrnT family toxin n=1 Tax=Metapseudomonas furukawaii TaxID=1149133 RepID=UPI00227A9437|nr:BrnT family toxin [Pseudomonas furukawaii]WAG79928.1 BrnT family toxin [Pseudomonas furukawaii]
MLRFEYDEAKSLANRVKHGIDFMTAQQLWNDPDLLEIPARTLDEPRYLVIARLLDRCWSAVITCRHGRIRIISVRRSRVEEVSLYESSGI